jgi:hypothetical protein
MPGKHRDGMAEQAYPIQREVLLGQGSSEPAPPTGCDDKGVHGSHVRT